MSLPRVLVDPPWRKRSGAAEVQAPAPAAPARSAPAPTLAWHEGERETFSGKRGPKLTEAAEEKVFERLLDELDKRVPLRGGEIGRLGDEKLAELAGELDASTTDAPTLKLVLGRLGDAFVNEAVAIVRAAPRERGLFEAAMPIESVDLARTAATASFERGVDTAHSRSPAEEWMLRHPRAVEALAHDDTKAVRAALAYCAVFGTVKGEGLEPFVAMRPLAERPELHHALVLATREDPRAISLLENEPAASAWVARARGAQAERELAAVPEAVAQLPAFFDVATLPKPTLRDGTPLPDDAIRALGEMLRFSPLAHPYAGLAQVREACDPASLDAFALALLEKWREAEEDPRQAWALETCGKIGGDACAREIATRVKAWARNANDQNHGFAFARTGLAILVAIGTETSRLLLEDIAQGGVQGWLRKEATVALGGEATHFDDVEAPVPDVGLDRDGSATFDTGKRVYKMAFDESLTPYLVDEQGERAGTVFPRAKKDDDAKKHATEKDRFATIVKDAKIVARFQVALLERIMCSQRTFAHAAFLERFITHPFLRHLGRRVVWTSKNETFRIAEDGTFANAQDEHVAIGEGPVGVAHPITMSPELREAWTARFADYRIMQPFPQLGRELFVRPPTEIGERDIKRVVDAATTRGRLFNLGRRDWRADFRRSDVTEYTKELPCGAAARIEVSPPVLHGGDADQKHTIVVATCSWSLDRLPPIDYSELMRDLEYARVGV